MFSVKDSIGKQSILVWIDQKTSLRRPFQVACPLLQNMGRVGIYRYWFVVFLGATLSESSTFIWDPNTMAAVESWKR